MQNFISLFALFVLLVTDLHSQTYSKETVIIETGYGKMKLKLFEETPLHKANFLKLVNEHYFDSLMFHRVINYFMIQGGDHLSRHAKPGDSLGHGDIGYTIPAEFKENIIHKKGRLAAAREGDDINPNQESSPTQFYIVMGKVRTMEDLKKYEVRINKGLYNRTAAAFIRSDEGKKMKKNYDRLKTENKNDSAAMMNAVIESVIQAEYSKTPEYKFSPYQIETYTTVGGTPHLDGSYTVFGEVIEGMEIIDKIAGVKTDKRDRPLEDIRMKVYLEK
jgi:peptidylprolyl isomerase